MIGLSVAKALLERDPTLRLRIVDKEDSIGKHSSGRNSGVLHSGFYYSPDTLKAKFCKEGNESLRKLCHDYRIPVLKVGKVVIARNSAEVGLLQALFERGRDNEIDLELLPASELIRFEPLARTFERFIWSPTTAVSDPQLVLAALLNSVKQLGARVMLGTKVSNNPYSMTIATNDNGHEFRHIINASGSQADRIAHDFGFSKNLSMIPFMGVYRAISAKYLPLSTLVYPVPEPKNPFLGVHFTRTLSGHVKVGPTAIPLLNREQYRFFEGWSQRDTIASLSGLMAMFRGQSHDLLKLASSELPKIFLKRLLQDAATLVPDVEHLNGWEKLIPGIRAQLIDLQSGTLVNDFVIEGDSQSTHILNAVSPGWTASIPFGQHIADRVLEKI